MPTINQTFVTNAPARSRSVSFGAGLTCCVVLTLALALVVSVALQLMANAPSGALSERTDRAEHLLKTAPPQS